MNNTQGENALSFLVYLMGFQMKILNEIDVQVDGNNVEAYHRLKSNSKSKKIIVNFSKRRDVETVLKN